MVSVSCVRDGSSLFWTPSCSFWCSSLVRVWFSLCLPTDLSQRRSSTQEKGGGAQNVKKGGLNVCLRKHHSGYSGVRPSPGLFCMQKISFFWQTYGVQNIRTAKNRISCRSREGRKSQQMAILGGNRGENAYFFCPLTLLVQSNSSRKNNIDFLCHRPGGAKKNRAAKKVGGLPTTV